MIDFETVKFIEMLNELARLSLGGIKPFSECKTENKDEGLFYDETTVMVNDISHSCRLFRIVLDKCVDEEIHHDIISYYDELFDGAYRVNFVQPMEEEPFIEVIGDDGADFVVENGQWRSV